MATRAIDVPDVRGLVPLLAFGGVLAVGLMAPLSAGLLDAPTIAGAREAVLGVGRGEILPLLSESRGLALIAGIVLVQPLAILGILLLIELKTGPREREAKNRRLTWLVQLSFLTFASILDYASAKLGLLPTEPLLRFRAADSAAGILLQILPMFLLTLLLTDFFRYWFHRAQHRFAFLWRFHAVHHSSRDLDVLHNFSHPVEVFGNLFLIAVPTAFLIGVESGQLYVVAAFFAVQGHLHHMNVPVHYGPLRHLVCDNRYHFVHHSRIRAESDSNYAGMFPLFDHLFGTYHAPAPGPLPATGLAEGQPTRLSHFLLARWPAEEGAGR